MKKMQNVRNKSAFTPLFVQFLVFCPPVPPSISLSLSGEVRSPSDPLISYLTKELWIPHTRGMQKTKEPKKPLQTDRIDAKISV